MENNLIVWQTPHKMSQSWYQASVQVSLALSLHLLALWTKVRFSIISSSSLTFFPLNFLNGDWLYKVFYGYCRMLIYKELVQNSNTKQLFKTLYTKQKEVSLPLSCYIINSFQWKFHIKWVSFWTWWISVTGLKPYKTHLDYVQM